MSDLRWVARFKNDVPALALVKTLTVVNGTYSVRELQHFLGPRFHSLIDSGPDTRLFRTQTEARSWLEARLRETLQRCEDRENDLRAQYLKLQGLTAEIQRVEESSEEDLSQLRPGDIVSNRTTGHSYVIIANDDRGTVATRTITITDPQEWVTYLRREEVE